jgi:phosphoribosylformylglycinamidine synthase
MSGMKPRVLILRTAGTNCDLETAHAFSLAGADPQSIHLNRLLEKPALIDDFQILAIPGGFSYGDDIAAGKILATQINLRLADALQHFLAARKPIIGICNGFQVLVKTNLLPGPIAGHTGQSATLAHNDAHRFIARWVYLSSNSGRCIWTTDLESPLYLPTAHGEGKFVPADDGIRQALWDNGLVALTYARSDGSPANAQTPDNPNGSIDDIAGICDPTGLILGLMPHPERHVHPTQHPAWTSTCPLPQSGAGLKLFQNAVAHVA